MIEVNRTLINIQGHLHFISLKDEMCNLHIVENLERNNSP